MYQQIGTGIVTNLVF